MKTFTLPGTEIVAPNVVLGLMRIADKSDDEIRELVRTARDAGIDFVDHADVYGRDLHECERRFAEAMQLSAVGARRVHHPDEGRHRARTGRTSTSRTSTSWSR